MSNSTAITSCSYPRDARKTIENNTQLDIVGNHRPLGGLQLVGPYQLGLGASVDIPEPDLWVAKKDREREREKPMTIFGNYSGENHYK